jgi:hypothetical protein
MLCPVLWGCAAICWARWYVRTVLDFSGIGGRDGGLSPPKKSARNVKGGGSVGHSFAPQPNRSSEFQVQLAHTICTLAMSTADLSIK